MDRSGLMRLSYRSIILSSWYTIIAISVILSRLAMPPVVSISIIAKRGLVKFVLLILVLSYLTQSKLIAFTELVYSKPKIILPGAYRMDSYLNLLDGKRVGLVVNQSSKLGQVHLVDTLLAKRFKLLKYLPRSMVFAEM